MVEYLHVLWDSTRRHGSVRLLLPLAAGFAQEGHIKPRGRMVKLNLIADAGFTRYIDDEDIDELKEDVYDMLKQYGGYGIVIETRQDD